MSKIALPIAELKPALSGFAKVIAKRTTLPVLNHVKIERTKDGWIALSATDLDTYVTLRLEQPSDGEPLSLLVPYDELAKITKSCERNESILAVVDKAGVRLQYPISPQFVETKVDSLPVEEFPGIPRIKGDSIPVPNALRLSLHEAFECASTDETRSIINSAYLDVSDAKCHHVVGTDGRHLYSSNSFNLPLKESIIIPTHRFLGWKEFNADGEWQIKLGDKPDKDSAPLLQIASRRWRFITRQREGIFPNWRQAVPTSFATTITVDGVIAEGVIHTVKRLPEHDKINHTIGIEAQGRTVNLLWKASGDDPWTRVQIEDAKFRGRDVTFYLNRHLFIKALNFGLHQFDVQDEKSAMRFTHEGRQMIVMPVRPDSAAYPQKPQAAPTPVAQQPAASPQAAQESTTMNKRTTPPAASPTSNSNGTSETSPASSIDTALAQIETIKGSYRDAIRGLNDLTDTLKQVHRDQKSTEKDVQSVRTTLEKLQRVQL